MHSQIEILKKESAFEVQKMISGIKLGRMSLRNARLMKESIRKCSNVDQNLAVVQKSFKETMRLDNVQAWSQSVIFVSKAGEAQQAKMKAAASDAKVKAKDQRKCVTSLIAAFSAVGHKTGHKVEKVLGSSDGRETKHADVADRSQPVSRPKRRQISQQFGEDLDDKPVTEASLTKQCNDGSLVANRNTGMREFLCTDDRSHGFGSSGCVQCQNQLCVKKNGAERCWRCNLLQEGKSLVFSCFRVAGAESTVCKSLLTDEAVQPWIGCRTAKAQHVPGNNFICRGHGQSKKSMGSTRTLPFPSAVQGSSVHKGTQRDKVCREKVQSVYAQRQEKVKHVQNARRSNLVNQSVLIVSRNFQSESMPVKSMSFNVQV